MAITRTSTSTARSRRPNSKRRPTRVTIKPHRPLPIRRNRVAPQPEPATNQPGVGRTDRFRLARTILNRIAGRWGAAAVSMLALWTTLRLTAVSATWFYEALLVIALARLIYVLDLGGRPPLGDHGVRTRFVHMLKDEGRILAIVAAFGFVLAWPITVSTFLMFAAVNIGLQVIRWITGRLIVNTLAHAAPRTSTAHRVLIVGTGSRARQMADAILNDADLDATVVGFLDRNRKGLWRYRDIPLAGTPDQLAEIVAGNQADALFLAVEPEELANGNDLLTTAEQMGLQVCVMPHLYTGTISKPTVVNLQGMPCLIYRRIPESKTAVIIKSIIDRIGGLVGLILFSPVMLTCAALIKLESPGPIMFKQVRSGLNGRPFYLYKFRTMRRNAEKQKANLRDRNEMSGPVFKIKEDPRITPIGQVLRKYSLDELPQFLNVLRGDMSLVGPRPPIPDEVARFEPWQRRKLSMKPGLTCIWQVSGRNQVDFEDWMRMDLQYIDNWSLGEDMRIMARTIPTVLKGTGM